MRRAGGKVAGEGVVLAAAAGQAPVAHRAGGVGTVEEDGLHTDGLEGGRAQPELPQIEAGVAKARQAELRAVGVQAGVEGAVGVEEDGLQAGAAGGARGGVAAGGGEDGEGVAARQREELRVDAEQARGVAQQLRQRHGLEFALRRAAQALERNETHAGDTQLPAEAEVVGEAVQVPAVADQADRSTYGLPSTFAAWRCLVYAVASGLSSVHMTIRAIRSVVCRVESFNALFSAVVRSIATCTTSASSFYRLTTAGIR